MNKNKRFATFEKHYATFRVNQKTYYDNVKQNFITQVNFVLWLWGVTQGRFLFFLTVKWFTIKKFARHNVRTQVRFCQTLKNLVGWCPMTDCKNVILNPEWSSLFLMTCQAAWLSIYVLIAEEFGNSHNWGLKG